MKKRQIRVKRSKLYSVTMWAVAAALAMGSTGAMADGPNYSANATYPDSMEHHSNGVTITNNAVINVSGSSHEKGLGGQSGLTVESGSTVNVSGSAVLYGGSQEGTIINGTVNLSDDAQLWFSKSGSDNVSDTGVINVSSGNVQIHTGESEVTNNGTINVASGAILTLKPGMDGGADSTISLVNGSISNAGTINNAGTMDTTSLSSVSIGGTVNNTGEWSAGSSAITVGDGGTLNNENGQINNGTSITVESGGTLIADASKSASINGGVEAQSGSNLKLTNLKAGNDVTGLFGGTHNGQGDLSGVNVTSTSSMLSVNADGTVSVVSASSALPGISGRLGAIVGNMYAAGLNDTNAAAAGVRFLSRATDGGYIADTKAAAKMVESAAKLAVIGGAPHMTWAIHQQNTHIMLNRTSLLMPKTGTMAVMDSETQTGASSGDKLNEGFAVWAIPFYQHLDASGMKSGNYDLDMDSDLAGLALGADYTFNNTRVGVAFNAGTGDVTGSGDFNRTSNDIDFWGFGLYFGRAIDNIGIKADISYTSTSNDMKQNIAGIGMDALKSDVDTRAISVGVEGEYQIKTASVDIAPYIGVRYTDMEVDNYRVKSGGETVLKGNAIDQKVWTFPVGVRLSKEVDNANGWQVKPSLDLAVIPAVGDTRADSRVQFVGVDGTANLTTRVMDNVSYMGQAGIEFVKKDLSFSLNYNYQGSSNSDMHSLFANVRYEF